MTLLFNLINIAQAHEEGATKITAENTLGPVLAVIIIIAAIIIAKRIIKKRNGFKTNQYDQSTN